MTELAPKSISVGVLGLGEPWANLWRPALDELGDRFSVKVLYDSVRLRADQEAVRRNVRLATSIRALVDDPEVELVLLATDAWYGAFPLTFLPSTGKRVLVSSPTRQTLEMVERLAPDKASPRDWCLLGLRWRFVPVTLRLRELFATCLGPPITLEATISVEPSELDDLGSSPAQPGTSQLMVELVDWCRFLFQGDPLTMQSADLDEKSAPNRRLMTMRFDEERWARIHFQPHSGESAPSFPVSARRRYPLSFRIETAVGSTVLEPNQPVVWIDSTGTHQESISRHDQSLGMLLEQVYRVFKGMPSLVPHAGDALAILRALRTLS